MTTVVNIRHKGAQWDVLVDRTTKWGNPYPVKVWGRKLAVALYSDWIINNTELMKALHELKGKRLGCHCAEGKPCHARVLAKLADMVP